MILDRQQFADHWNDEKPGLGNSNSPLWIPETFDSMIIQCEWFVCVKPLKVHYFKDQFWTWCEENLSGYCRCFSSNTDDSEEWWGFTDKTDLTIWMLKWAQ